MMTALKRSFFGYFATLLQDISSILEMPKTKNVRRLGTSGILISKTFSAILVPCFTHFARTNFSIFRFDCVCAV